MTIKICDCVGDGDFISINANEGDEEVRIEIKTNEGVKASIYIDAIDFLAAFSAIKKLIKKPKQ